jgi:hypothetical protein
MRQAEYRREPIYWFFAAERARKTRNPERLRLCLDRLAKLGVQIEYRKPQGASNGNG